MEAERWEEIKRLYHAALELEKSRWPAFLEEASGGDQALAREVLSLLAQSEGTAGFLDAPASPLDRGSPRLLRTLPFSNPPPHPITRFRY